MNRYETSIEEFDRMAYEADEQIRRNDHDDDIDSYRPRLYTGATTRDLSDREIAARRRARRRF